MDDDHKKRMLRIEFGLEGLFEFKLGMPLEMWLQVAEQIMANPMLSMLLKGAVPQPPTAEEEVSEGADDLDDEPNELMDWLKSLSGDNDDPRWDWTKNFE